MNSIMTNYYPMFRMYQALRSQLMELLDDGDLSFTPGNGNPSLGALCRELGEVEQAYIDSFKTFTQDFSYRNSDPTLEQRVARLSAWFAELDAALEQTVAGLSEDDIAERVIDRGQNFKLPPMIQLEVYKEALLIFYGKARVYVSALGKPLPEQWQEWIG
jgi:uncharacterized damage-inducible protein DinB